MDLGVPELAVIVIAVLLLFGYKRLPDASRAIGRSLRIFKGEMKGMKDDDVRAGAPVAATPALGQAASAAAPAGAAAGDLSAQLLEEARAAEAHAAELRARAARAGAEG